MEPASSPALGIDIGGTSVKAAVLRDGRVVGTGRSDRYQQPDVVRIRAAIDQALAQAFAVSDASGKHEILALGLCVPGIVDGSSKVIRTSANVPALVGVPLVDLLPDSVMHSGQAAGRTLTPRVLSDAHAAAIDLAHELALAPGQRLLAISIGTGVGACVLDGGPAVGTGTRLLVAEGSSGHLGFIDVRQHESGRPIPTARDGSLGSLEAYIGLPVLEARYGLTGEAAIARVAPGEAPFAALVQALRIAHAIYRPNIIALLGGIGLRLRPQLEALHHHLADRLTTLARTGWRLTCGTSDHHAAAGAARWALAQHERPASQA